MSFLFVQNHIYFVGETSEKHCFKALSLLYFVPLFAVDLTVKNCHLSCNTSNEPIFTTFQRATALLLVLTLVVKSNKALRSLPATAACSSRNGTALAHNEDKMVKRYRSRLEDQPTITHDGIKRIPWAHYLGFDCWVESDTSSDEEEENESDEARAQRLRRKRQKQHKELERQESTNMSREERLHRREKLRVLKMIPSTEEENGDGAETKATRTRYRDDSATNDTTSKSNKNKKNNAKKLLYSPEDNSNSANNHTNGPRLGTLSSSMEVMTNVDKAVY